MMVAVVEEVEVSDAAAAQALRFPGSPTIRINGVDAEPNEQLSFGLACRLYSSAGHVPSQASLRRACQPRTPIKTTHPHFSSIEFLQYGPLTNFSLASNAFPGSTLATSKSRLGPFRRLPLADRLRRRNQAPSPAHGGPVIFIGGSTKEAYLKVLTMSTAVGT
jgi:hypothetical protein